MVLHQYSHGNCLGLLDGTVGKRITPAMQGRFNLGQGRSLEEVVPLRILAGKVSP